MSLERELWSAFGLSRLEWRQRLKLRGELDGASKSQTSLKPCGGKRGGENRGAVTARWDELSHPCDAPLSSLCPADSDHNLYIFKGSRFWVVSASGNASEPRPLQARWPGLPAGIDACAWSRLSGKLFFFKGRWGVGR